MAAEESPRRPTVAYLPPMHLGGFTVGHAPDPECLRGYIVDGEEVEGCVFWQRFEPNVSVLLCDGTVVSITARDECMYCGLDLIGMSISGAIDTLAASINNIEHGEVSIYELDCGIELYVRSGDVTQVSLSDFSSVPASLD